jgi:maltooligosyltrehalose trehalohydrolase
VQLSVWAPHVRQLTVHLVDSQRSIAMQRRDDDVYTTIVRGLSPGDRYAYNLDGVRLRPDPVSRWQLESVHGSSVIVDATAFRWTALEWRGIALQDLILYELHCGTFTQEGTFAAIISFLDYRKDDLGVTAVALMPVAAFPGARNWRYDGVHLYAPHADYGGLLGLKSLVNACYEKGLAVVLDVMYNHLGPEGNYLGEYGPYFTDRYQALWGQAVNLDGDRSREVRRYFIDNVLLYWVTEYHIDELRLDVGSRPLTLRQTSTGEAPGSLGYPAFSREVFHSGYPSLRSPLRSTGGTQKLKT